MANVNLVEITKVEYADADLIAGVVPSTLKTIGTIKEGNCNLDFPEASTTPEYSEQTQKAYRIRRSPVMNKCMVELVTEDSEQLADLIGAKHASATGTESITIDGTSTPKNKYVIITGKNIEGQVVTITMFNTFLTNSWSGNMGANQETVGWKVTFNMLQDASASPKECQIDIITA